MSYEIFPNPLERSFSRSSRLRMCARSIQLYTVQPQRGRFLFIREKSPRANTSMIILAAECDVASLRAARIFLLKAGNAVDR
jgi:hypothetical protein